MRLQVLSDLHLEFDRDGGEAFARDLPVRGDVLVLAGDVVPLRSREEALRALGWFCGRFPRVLFVPGNHEYYGTSPARAAAVLAACERELSSLRVLCPGIEVIEGVRFVGTTLWFPETEDERSFRPMLSDFAVIEGFVPWVHQTHEAHLTFLRGEVREGDVVITHHLPHPKSVAPHWRGSPLNRFFLSEDAAPLVPRARLWIHGHTHDPCDYTVGTARVLCNPRGYPSEKKRPFDPELVVRMPAGDAG